jgi:arsenate reductase
MSNAQARPYNVLFLCTGNSARSVLAEALLSREGGDRFRAFSAGSFPKGVVHPMSLEVLKLLGYPTDQFRSKSWDEFTGPDAPPIDFVFTVCDNAAGEVCPIWPGHPMTAHWGLDDPAAVEGKGQEEAFLRAYRYLENRISALLALPIESMDQAGLKGKLRQIGQSEGSTTTAAADAG